MLGHPIGVFELPDNLTHLRFLVSFQQHDEGEPVVGWPVLVAYDWHSWHALGKLLDQSKLDWFTGGMQTLIIPTRIILPDSAFRFHDSFRQLTVNY